MTEYEGWNDSDFDWEPVEPPRRVTVDEQRQMAGSWIPAKPEGAPLARREWSGPVPAPLGDAAPLAPVEGAWKPVESVKEVGTPVHRALATVIKSAPFVALALPVTVGIVWLLGVSGWWVLPSWGCVSAGGYLLLLWLDLTFNAPSAVERHRTNKRYNLDRYIAGREYDLREKVVDAWLNWLDREGR